jgi:hypothetical protein
MPPSSSYSRRTTLFLIPLVYSASFFLSVFDDAPGWQVFLLGIWGCILAPLSVWDGLSKVHFGLFACYAWLANPLLWVAYAKLFGKSPARATKLAVWALVLATAFGVYSFTSLLDAGKSRCLGLGYWLWLLSMALATCTAYTSKEDSPRRWFPSNENLREALRHLGTPDSAHRPTDDRVRSAGQHEHVCRGAGE